MNDFWEGFKAAMNMRGFQPVNSVDDLLPEGHPLKGKPKPESEKHWKAMMDGSAFEDGKQLPKGFNQTQDKDVREKYTHLIQPGSKQTYCGFEATDDQIGAWREGTPQELSAEPCPGCLKGRMNDETTGSSEAVPSGEGSS